MTKNGTPASSSGALVSMQTAPAAHPTALAEAFQVALRTAQKAAFPGAVAPGDTLAHNDDGTETIAWAAGVAPRVPANLATSVRSAILQAVKENRASDLKHLGSQAGKAGSAIGFALLAPDLLLVVVVGKATGSRPAPIHSGVFPC